jgi:acetyl esterase/lipase
MKRTTVCTVLACLCLTQLSSAGQAKVAHEHLLWPDGIKNNPIRYDEPNRMRRYDAHPDAPLGTCRVYSNVQTPTYYIYQPAPNKNTGVAMVVLPGGGYRDIWLDKEGHDIALFFQARGITSLVVKYRTNTKDPNGQAQMSREQYVPHAVRDAQQGIRILRARADKLNIDPNKIGMGGFSAGGHLTLSVCLSPVEKDSQSYPDFAFLIYPWLMEYFESQVPPAAKRLPPMFMVNGQEDDVTPPGMCASFYQSLCSNKVPAEMHIYAKGRHGFSLGLGTGHSPMQWTNSFMQWLKDINMIKH